MSLERLRWLLPTLILFWTSLQSSTALPAHNERSHVSANTFDPSAATSTITRQHRDIRAHHLAIGKNETQSSHKLVASPAGLLRPDKFQFYTYNEKGDMITRQMTAQEIQGLIAAGGTDHVVDRQEPQKADDVLTGGKKVMDVVQKVQSVLKSALDKPPTLTGSIPKIPEHANVDWSNILPSILSSDTDSIPPNSELTHKITTEKAEIGSTSKYPTKRPDVQTNAYAGFTNNVQTKPQHHHSQQTLATEKPMIPVPVITLAEQKLSTLSTVTESPVFQIISVIPVESAGIKKDQSDPSTIGTSVSNLATTQLPAQTEKSQTEQYVELTLSEVPASTIPSRSTSSDPAGITKKTTASNKINQESTTPYSTTAPSESTYSSSTKKTATYDGFSELPIDKTSFSNADYVLVPSKNNTKISNESSSSDVTKNSQVNNDDKTVTQTNTLAALVPISHAPPKPEEASKGTTPQSSSTFNSFTKIKTPSVVTSLQTSDDRLAEGSSTVMKESSSVTSTYGENHLNPLPTEIQSSPSIEPLPTQLFDSFSSVINQVSEVKPPILPLSNEGAEIPIMNINYDQRPNVFDANGTAAVRDEIVRPNDIQTYVTLTTEIPTRNITTELPDYRPLNAMDRESSTIDDLASSRITTTTSTTPTKIGTTNNRVVTNNLAMPAGFSSIGTTIVGSTASSPASLQFEKVHATVAASPLNPTENSAISEGITERITLFEKISTSIASDATKTQPTTTPINQRPSSKPTTIDEYFGNTLASLNFSNPVSAIDQVLSIAPLPSSIPAIEPIGLPNNTSNFIASGLASGLIAGFTSAGSTEKIGSDQTIVTTDNHTKFTQEFTENVTKMFEQMGLDSNDQKERNVTQLEILTDTAQNGTLIYGALTETKESNDTKLSSNERIDDSTKPASSINKSANISSDSKDSVGQSATTVGIVTVNPEQITTNVRSPGINKTMIGTSSNQKKTEIKEKTRTTETPIVRTDVKTELSQLPQLSMKIVNDTKNSEYAKNSSNVEVLNKTNDSFSDISSIKETIHSINDSTKLNHSSTSNNLTTNTSVLNISNGTSLQNYNISTVDYKNQNNTQNKKDNNDSIKKHTDSSIKFITQESNNANGNKAGISQPVNNTSHDKNNKNVTQNISTVNVSTKSDGSSNNTESKIASLKHSESLSKPIHSQTPSSNVPVHQTSKPTVTQRPLEKSDIKKTDTNVNSEDKWTLISQQVPSVVSKPPKLPKPLRKPVNAQTMSSSSNVDENAHIRSPGVEAAAQDSQQSSTQSLLPLDTSQSAIGLDTTTRHTSADIINFAKLCNELAFNFWVATNKGLSTARSLALSPFGMTSLLAMIFLGARGPTSDQMNEVLGLDDVATFNPHLVFQNITDTVSLARGQGIANAAFVRELFADKMKVRKLMPFYKEQAQQFYEGLVTEVNFATISDLVRRRTNLLVRKQTGGRIKDFVKTNTVPLRSPLAALSANVFQTDCNSSLTSSVGRDGELYFAVSPAVRQRKLVPVPATTWRSGVLAGYEPSIDATAIALGGSDKLISTIFILPGQQGHTAPGDNLDRLEQRLVRSAFRDGAWNKLLKVLIPRHGLELQVPKFSHRSVVNATAALKRMGLDELFSGNADFKGINGIGHRLHLADVLQMNLFSTCGDENILSGRHHVETYPASPLRRNIERRMENDDSGNIGEEDVRYRMLSQEDNGDSFTELYSDLFGFYREDRQLSGSERPRLKLDRPFLYFVRHNPSGIILHMGRFNPRLLP